MFLISIILTLTGMYLYIGQKIAGPAKISRPAAAAVKIVLPLFMTAFHLSPYFIMGNGPGGRYLDLLFWTSYTVLGYASILFLVFLAKDGANVIWRVANKIAGTIRAILRTCAKPIHPKDPGKRLFLAGSVNFGLMGLSTALTGYGIYEARRIPGVVKLKVEIAGLPPDLENLRIVQITDLHVSATLKKPFVETVVETVNRLTPDLIAVTGDLVDGSVSRLRQDVAPLSRLTAPMGAYFVTGNHEYYSGARVWMEEMRQLGLIVLENEHRIAVKGNGRLLVAGVNDFHAGAFYASHASSPSRALLGAAPHHTRLLLAHQPKSIFDAADAGYHLQLSGHTHGGQYYPFHHLVALNQPYVSGLHRHRDTWIYVSRGTGYWGPPLRLGSPSEITEITLAAA